MEKQEFEEKVAKYAYKHKLLAKKGKVIVTLSGGADSVALLLVLSELGVCCTALHCNFHLRGAESDRDEDFVRYLCESRHIPLLVKHFDVQAYVHSHKVSVEMACRELRYEWFEAERERGGYSAIAVAHHSDDNVETLFLNMFRGTGVTGLAGIKPRNGYIIRPLLAVSRTDIEDYLQECKQDYVVDSTNLESDYKRNKVRNKVMPMVRELFPEGEGGIKRTLDNMLYCNSLYQYMIADLRKRIVTISGDVHSVDVQKIMDMGDVANVALYELVREYGFNSVQSAEMYNCMLEGNATGKVFYAPQEYMATINRGTIDIAHITEGGEYAVEVDLHNDIDKPVRVRVQLCTKEEGSMNLEGVDGKNIVIFNAAMLNGRKFVLRHWLVGDRLKPFGLKGSKLVSDLFADCKLSEIEKRKVWLLVDESGQIAWVLGIRAADYCRVTKADTEYIRLELL